MELEDQPYSGLLVILILECNLYPGKGVSRTCTCAMLHVVSLGLRTLLLLIYINDLANVSDKLLPVLFADDTNVFLTGRNVTDLINSMNEELHKLVNWLQINKHSLNVSKTICILFCFTRKHCVSDVKVNIKSENIQLDKSTKFLGDIIDKHLL